MKVKDFFLVGLSILGLILVRVFENEIFYDPFLFYFHEAYKDAPFPDYDIKLLIFSHITRFLMNLFFSVAIIHFIFKDKKWTVYSAISILFVFAITFPIYLYCIHTKFDVGYLFSFYMRRFVIQPLILLFLIPMFYYLKNNPKEQEN